MRHRWIAAFVATAALWLLPQFVMPSSAQNNTQRAPAQPAPRFPDGRINIGPLPGQSGVWLPAAAGLTRADSPNANGVLQNPTNPKVSDVPFQPWARALYDYRQLNEFEPHTRCKPSGGTRQFFTPYGVEFVDMPEMKRMFIMDIGGPHTYRIIFMDGRLHPKDLAPSYYGHSIGRWEGDTLVVDTTGFNEKFWFDREGSPHTEALRVIERFTRMDSNTMKYEVTVDDPGAYTAIWNSGFNLRWVDGQELVEYVCQANNFAPELMIGAQKSVDRRSKIVP